MLLMPTADTTASHGLEDSPRLDAPSKSNASFLVQMPLAILGSFLRKQPPSSSEPISLPNLDQPAPDPQQHVMTTTPNAPLTLSRPPSSSSSAAEGKPRERLPRSKTSYLIAKPAQPVKSRSKVHIRPKVLLQLHQVIASQHPKPIYEFIPFSILPQRSTRRFARTFNTRERLGPKDLLIIKADDYSTKEAESRSDEERWGSREVIGVITPGRCEKGITGPTEICMADGTTRWEVFLMRNGGYEFNTVDDHGLSQKARWVLKSANSRRISGTISSSPHSLKFPSGQDNKRFTFSTISPNSRRHPVIATMTRTRIDVHDTYSMPSATSPPTPIFASNTPPSVTPSSIDTNSFLELSNTSHPITTDDALRRFIVVSGLWVAFQDFSSLDNDFSPLSTSASSRPQQNRSMPLMESPRSASPASTVDENYLSVPRMVRRSLEKLPRCASFTEAPISINSTKTPSNATSFLKTRSRRANSTGNVHLHTMTGSLKKNTFDDQTLPESEEERQNRRSSEIFQLKQSLVRTHVAEDDAGQELPSKPPRTATAPLSNDLTHPATKSVRKVSSQQFSRPPQDADRDRKTQSAFNPVTTAGLWDSGVTEGSGFRKNPTSIFVMNERKKKLDKKSERSRSKEKRRSMENPEDLGFKGKSGWYRYKLTYRVKEIFRRDKS